MSTYIHACTCTLCISVVSICIAHVREVTRNFSCFNHLVSAYWLVFVVRPSIRGGVSVCLRSRTYFCMWALAERRPFVECSCMHTCENSTVSLQLKGARRDVCALHSAS